MLVQPAEDAPAAVLGPDVHRVYPQHRAVPPVRPLRQQQQAADNPAVELRQPALTLGRIPQHGLHATADRGLLQPEAFGLPSGSTLKDHQDRCVGLAGRADENRHLLSLLIAGGSHRDMPALRHVKHIGIPPGRDRTRTCDLFLVREAL